MDSDIRASQKCRIENGASGWKARGFYSNCRAGNQRETGGRGSGCRSRKALLDERSFNHKVALIAVARFLETKLAQDFAGVLEHRGTAAQHEAVVFEIRYGQAHIAEQFAGKHQ